MELTIQKLANMCNHSWELQREVGFHMQSPANFRKFLTELPDAQLRVIMENLGLLFRSVEEIGQAEVELKANGSPSMFAPLAQTQTSKAVGSPEYLKTGDAPQDAMG